jgi:hypothetical protein
MGKKETLVEFGGSLLKRVNELHTLFKLIGEDLLNEVTELKSQVAQMRNDVQDVFDTLDVKWYWDDEHAGPSKPKSWCRFHKAYEPGVPHEDADYMPEDDTKLQKERAARKVSENTLPLLSGLLGMFVPDQRCQGKCDKCGK